MAFTTIDDIHQRKQVPFLVGGTALYLRSVIEGLRIPEVPPNLALRLELEAQLAAEGVGALFAQLQQLDPASALAIDGRNPRRVLRALEIVITTGRSKVEMEGSDPPPYRILQIGLTQDREALYQRIDQRIDQMLATGLLDETKRLLALGYTLSLPAMSSLGYRECVAHIRGEMTLHEAAVATKIETHRFVRHQYTAFRRMKEIQWFDIDSDPFQKIFEMVQDFL